MYRSQNLTLRTCSMSPAAKPRLDMLFNVVCNPYEAVKIVGHALCQWDKPLVRYFEWFYATMVNSMVFTCVGAKI